MQVDQLNTGNVEDSSTTWETIDDDTRQELCSDASAFIVDPQFRITWANEGFYRQNLTHQHEVVGQPAQQFLPKRFFTEEGKNSVSLRYIRSCLHNATEVCRAEANHFRRDGTSFWVSLDFIPVSDGSGLMTSCMVLQRDITVLRERRQQLHRTAMIARYTNNPIVITGPDFVVEWVNEAWVRTTGYEVDEILGRESRELLAGRNTEESAVLEAYKTVREGHCASYETTYYRKDGTPFIVAIDAYPVIGENGEANYFAVYRDITQSRRMRDELLRMAMVAQYTENGVLITDPTGVVEWINHGFTALLGYSLADLEGRDARSLMCDSASVDWDEVHRHLGQHKSISRQVAFKSSSDESCLLDIDMTPIFDDEGSLLNIILIQRRRPQPAEADLTAH